MTVGELRKKLEIYKDDVEIFIGNYDDLHGNTYFADPYIAQETVQARILDDGEILYSEHVYWKRVKHATILVIS